MSLQEVEDPSGKVNRDLWGEDAWRILFTNSLVVLDEFRAEKHKTAETDLWSIPFFIYKSSKIIGSVVQDSRSNGLLQLWSYGSDLNCPSLVHVINTCSLPGAVWKGCAAFRKWSMASGMERL